MSLSHLPAGVAILHLIMILVPAGTAVATLFPVPGPVRMFAPTLITPGVPPGLLYVARCALEDRAQHENRHGDQDHDANAFLPGDCVLLARLVRTG